MPNTKTILYVEDNEDNIYMLTRRLEKRGFRVITAIDGLKGVAKAKKEKPDLILMDLVLPKLDGWEAAYRIKTNKETMEIPIIGLSASVSKDDIQSAFESGCNDVETKPVDLERLLEKINHYLD